MTRRTQREIGWLLLIVVVALLFGWALTGGFHLPGGGGGPSVPAPGSG